MLRSMLLLVVVLMTACSDSDEPPLECNDLGLALHERAVELGCDPGRIHESYAFACILVGSDMTQEDARGCMAAVEDMDTCPEGDFRPPDECFW